MISPESTPKNSPPFPLIMWGSRSLLSVSTVVITILHSAEVVPLYSQVMISSPVARWTRKPPFSLCRPALAQFRGMRLGDHYEPLQRSTFESYFAVTSWRICGCSPLMLVPVPPCEHNTKAFLISWQAFPYRSCDGTVVLGYRSINWSLVVSSKYYPSITNLPLSPEESL